MRESDRNCDHGVPQGADQDLRVSMESPQQCDRCALAHEHAWVDSGKAVLLLTTVLCFQPEEGVLTLRGSSGPCTVLGNSKTRDSVA